MTVSCIECRDTYAVEPDAFHDGGEKYYMEFLVASLRHKRKGATTGCTGDEADHVDFAKDVDPQLDTPKDHGSCQFCT